MSVLGVLVAASLIVLTAVTFIATWRFRAWVDRWIDRRFSVDLAESDLSIHTPPERDPS